MRGQNSKKCLHSSSVRSARTYWKTSQRAQTVRDSSAAAAWISGWAGTRLAHSASVSSRRSKYRAKSETCSTCANSIVHTAAGRHFPTSTGSGTSGRARSALSSRSVPSAQWISAWCRTAWCGTFRTTVKVNSFSALTATWMSTRCIMTSNCCNRTRVMSVQRTCAGWLVCTRDWDS